MAQKSGRFSIIPARAIDDPRLGKAALVVLCALGTYSDREGWCWPKIDTLAERLRVKRRQVLYCLRELDELGYVEVKARFHDNGKQRSNGYRVLHDAELPAELLDPGEGEAELQGGVHLDCTQNVPN